MNHYEQKQEARRERILARADRLRSEGQSRYKSGMDRLKAIPFGQPMLVDHYSYKRDRNYRRKAVGSIDKGCELMKAADEAERRAEAVGTGGVSSDDPQAITKLEGQLASLQANQRQMLAINKAWKKAGSPAPDDLVGWQKVADAPDVMMNVNDLARVRELLARKLVVRPFPSYSLSNNSANMRRIEQRIEILKRNANRETKVEELQGVVKIVQNAEANRVQLIFPGKPDADVRTKLKRSGFRWSPSEGAWQRHLNNAGIWAAQQIVKELTA